MYVVFTDNLILGTGSAEICAEFNAESDTGLRFDDIKGAQIASATDRLAGLIYDGYSIDRWWVTDTGHIDGESNSYDSDI